MENIIDYSYSDQLDEHNYSEDQELNLGESENTRAELLEMKKRMRKIKRMKRRIDAELRMRTENADNQDLNNFDNRFTLWSPLDRPM